MPTLSSWTIYLPGAAATGLTQVALTDQNLLQPWQGGLVLAGYAMAFAICGIRLTIRRDVT